MDDEQQPPPPLPPPSADPLFVNDAKIKLLKIPLFAANTWRKQPPGDIVGLFCTKDGESRIILATPRLQQLQCRSSPCDRTHIISNVEGNCGASSRWLSPFTGMPIGEKANAAGVVAEAAVVETMTAAPILDDCTYKSLLKDRKDYTDARPVVETAVDAGNGRPLPRLFKYYHEAGEAGDEDEEFGVAVGGGGNGGPKRQKLGPESVQLRKDEVRMKLFEILESRLPSDPGLTMTDLMRLTRQPQHFLKPLLDEFAVAQTGGGDRRRLFYVLRPEYSK